MTLIKLVNLINGHVREIDLLARWGGDEFMILLPNTPLAEAQNVADKFRVLIKNEHITPDLVVTASFGIAKLKTNEDPQQLIVRTDKALYRAKSEGRDRVCSQQ
jgi:diguanylate cyclase (GGDEF)-like protein